MITLGYSPQPLTVNLSRGSVFSAGLQNNQGPWPDGTVIRLTFTPFVGDPVDWLATISADLASWSVDGTQVDAVIDAGKGYVRLWYAVGESNPVLWMSGAVQVTP